MPVKRTYRARKRRVARPRYGGSFFGDVGNALSKAHDFIKSHKLVSSVANGLSAAGVPYAGTVGKIAGILGYGAPRRRRARGGAFDIKGALTKAHTFVKEKKLISNALKHFGHNKLSAAAKSLGYGAPRRRPVRRRRGGAFDVRGALAKAHAYVKKERLISSAVRHFLPNSNAHKAIHALGYGAGRRVTHRGYGGANFFSTDQIAAPKF